jgi:hypothetical protein
VHTPFCKGACCVTLTRSLLIRQGTAPCPACPARHRLATCYLQCTDTTLNRPVAEKGMLRHHTLSDMPSPDEYLRQVIRDFQGRCLPPPREPQPSSEVRLYDFLWLLHLVHSFTRYHFRIFALRSPVASNQPWPPHSSSVALDTQLKRLACALTTSSPQSKIELMRLRVLDDEEKILFLLSALFQSFPHSPPGYRPINGGPTSITADSAVLGYSNFTRSSLPLAEAVMLPRIIGADSSAISAKFI